MALMFVLFGRRLIGLFSDEPAVIALGAEVLLFVAVFQLFDAVALTYAHALRGAGDTRWPAVVGAVQAWGIMIGGGAWVAWAHPELGSRGPWFFATLFIFVIGSSFWLRWRGGAWEKLDAIDRLAPNEVTDAAMRTAALRAEPAVMPEPTAEPQPVGTEAD
jgi:Na+-driven multidrug efflux pump